MRLASLHLRAYGPFERAVLDLDAPRAGLQIVHGPNERGKSTALRAIGALLFGFAPRTEDAFGRDYAALRVGAVVEDGGRRLALMRRKGTQRTLFEFDPASGEERPDRTVEQAVVDGLLGGVDAARFAAMHALGSDQLRLGGRTLLDSGSELGATLFEAAGGVPRLRAVAAALKAEADALFLPNGRVPRLNLALAELAAGTEAARAAGLRPRDWARLRDERDRAEDSVRAIEARLREQRARQAHVDRLIGLGPQVARLEALQLRIAALHDAPRLAPDAGERLAALRQSLEESERACADALADRDRLLAALGALDPSQPHLDAAPDIVLLGARLEDLEAVRRARPGLLAAEETATLTLRRALAAIDPDPASADATPAQAAARAESLAPPRAQVAEARRLASAHRALEARRTDAVDACRLAGRALALSRTALQAAQAPADVSVLAAALDAAAADGDLERRTAALRARLEADDTALSAQAAALEAQDVRALARLALPSAGEVERASQAARAGLAGIESLRERIAALLDETAPLRAAREALAGQRAVVDRDALQSARTARDAQLAEARGAADEAARTQAFGALEADILAADRAADARFDDAARIADLESLTARITAADGRVEALRERLAQAGSALAEAGRAWHARLHAAGLPPLEPSDWPERLARQARLLDALRLRDELAADLRAGEADIARHLGLLDDAWRAVRHEPPALPTLAGRLAHGRALIEASRLAAAEHRRLQEAHLRDADELAAREAVLAGFEASFAAAAPAWAAAATALALDAGVSCTALEARLEAFDALRDALAVWEGAERERRLADGRLDAFRADAASLARRLGVAPPAHDAEPAFVAGCGTALADAQRARDERMRLQGERATLEAGLAVAERRRDEARAGLEALRVQAGVADPTALADAVARSDARREALGEAERTESTVRATTGAAHDALLAALAASDASGLLAEREALGQSIADHESERDAALGERTRSQAALDAVDGDGAASRAAEAVRDRLAASARLAVDVARLRLARELLEQSVQRHAQRVQGPLLSAASRWFARITDGRWGALRPDWSGDRQVLLAEREDGVRLPVEQLSEGTADALFLALRLAAIDVRLGASPPVPLLLDDVLMTFDDGRAARTLQGLAELGERNQVVYFTHHAHLVELARSVLPPGAVSVTELRQGPAPADTDAGAKVA
jgi:uncharacterized protein YhaN